LLAPAVRYWFERNANYDVLTLAVLLSAEADLPDDVVMLLARLVEQPVAPTLRALPPKMASLARVRQK
jgi:hypothetical protein